MNYLFLSFLVILISILIPSPAHTIATKRTDLVMENRNLQDVGYSFFTSLLSQLMGTANFQTINSTPTFSNNQFGKSNQIDNFTNNIEQFNGDSNISEFEGKNKQTQVNKNIQNSTEESKIQQNRSEIQNQNKTQESQRTKNLNQQIQINSKKTENITENSKQTTSQKTGIQDNTSKNSTLQKTTSNSIQNTTDNSTNGNYENQSIVQQTKKPNIESQEEKDQNQQENRYQNPQFGKVDENEEKSDSGNINEEPAKPESYQEPKELQKYQIMAIAIVSVLVVILMVVGACYYKRCIKGFANQEKKYIFESVQYEEAPNSEHGK